MTVSLSAGGIGLGSKWGREKAGEIVHAAGFTRIEAKELENDFQNYFYIISKN